MINREELKAKIGAFIAAQDNARHDEWYDTDLGIATEIMQRFEQFLFGEEDAKAERRRQYEELKKEFVL